MKVHVVAVQKGNNHHFDVETERVPQIRELFVSSSTLYSVENVMTYRNGNNKGLVVMTVTKAQADENMESLINELDRQLR